MEEGGPDLRAAVAAHVHVPAVEAILVVTPGVVRSHVAVLRARVLLVPNHIPGRGQIRDGLMIDLVQGSFS